MLGQLRRRSPRAEEIATFGGSVADWPAFPDSAAALARLHSRFKLGVITNCDDDLFAASEQRLGLSFDWVVTAQQAKRYKPNPRGFELMFERVGLPPSRILHVAQSLFHDHVTAKRLGLSTVWVDRRSGRSGLAARRRRPQATPDLTVPDMATLAALAVPGVSGDGAGRRPAARAARSRRRSSGAAASWTSGSTPSRPPTATAPPATSRATPGACAWSPSTTGTACCSSASGATRPAGRCWRSRPARSTASRTGPIEDHAVAAARELEEETGSRAGTWRYLGGFYTAPGFTSELMHLYLATELTSAHEDGLHPDEDERLELYPIPFAEAVAMASAARSATRRRWSACCGSVASGSTTRSTPWPSIASRAKLQPVRQMFDRTAGGRAAGVPPTSRASKVRLDGRWPRLAWIRTCSAFGSCIRCTNAREREPPIARSLIEMRRRGPCRVGG